MTAPAVKRMHLNVKKLRPLLPLAVIILALFITGLTALTLYRHMNSAKNGLEQLAANTLGVPVSIGTLTIDKQNRRIILKDLTIHNPPDFEHPYLFKARHIEIITENSRDHQLIVSSITVDQASLALMRHYDGTNLTALRTGTDSRANLKWHNRPGRVPVRVVMRQFEMSDLTLTTPAADSANAAPAWEKTIPLIYLENPGNELRGLQASALIIYLYDHIAREALLVAAREGLFEDISVRAAHDINKLLGTAPTPVERISTRIEQTLHKIRRRSLIVE